MVVLVRWSSVDDFVFFKQKTAYEMRISDWSSDVCSSDLMVAGHVVKAAARGAKIVLPPELFEGPYFCKVEEEELFANALPLDEHPAVQEMRKEIGRASCRGRVCQYV